MSQLSKNPKAPPRYFALDGYRFIAALGVVVYHFDPEFGLGLARHSPAVAQLNVFVDFFFILSGFVIAAAYRDRMANPSDWLRFLRARVARLYPLHLLTLAASLSLVVAAAATGVKPNHPELFALSGLPANLSLTQAWGFLDHPSFNVPSWSISAEWFVYLLTPLVFLAVARAPVGLALAAIVAFVAVMTFVRQAAGLGPWTEAAYDFGAFRALPSFVLGVVIAFGLDRVAARVSVGPWIGALCFVGAVAALHFRAQFLVVWGLFAVTIASCALAERAGRPGVMAAPLMRRLGDISYTLYMTHLLIATPVLFVVRRYGLAGSWRGAAAALATAGASILVSLVVYRYFELPAKRLILGNGGSGSDAIAAQGVAVR